MRTILINIQVFLLASSALYFSLPVVNTLVHTFALFSVGPSDKRADLPNYEGQQWAKTHFREFSELQTDFFSYIGWRRRPFTGETITIEKETRIRHTPQIASDDHGRVVYFFGGSAMWGTGSDDAHTIPAQYQAITGEIVLNFGETAWVAHQGLNQLIKLYTQGERPNDVVFYDGVNEVEHKCRNDNDFWAYDRQQQIRQMLALPSPFAIRYYFRPVVNAGQVVARTIGLQKNEIKEGDYDCDRNSRKADLIAEQLITDWKITAMIVESYGAHFHAYLQPVSYFSRTRKEHLGSLEEPLLRDQFLTVYPLVRHKMAQYSVGSDLTEIFDRDEYIFVDFCHASPNGNAIVAARIATDIKAGKKP